MAREKLTESQKLIERIQDLARDLEDAAQEILSAADDLDEVAFPAPAPPPSGAMETLHEVYELLLAGRTDDGTVTLGLILFPKFKSPAEAMKAYEAATKRANVQ